MASGEQANEKTMQRSPEQVARFVTLSTAHHRDLYGFVFSLLRNEADAEDVVQQANIVAWEKFDTFAPGTSFVNWIVQIAYNKIRDLRKCKAREPLSFWSHELMDTVAGAYLQNTGELHDRREALAECIDRLAASDRELLRRRYRQASTIKQLAEEIGRPVNTVYKALRRLHTALHECVQRRVAAR